MAACCVLPFAGCFVARLQGRAGNGSLRTHSVAAAASGIAMLMI
jgi:hypothetical protein